MKRRLMTWLAACLAAGSVRAADEPWLAYPATMVREAPVIDGRLTDACWQGLEQTRPLTCIGGAPAPIVTTGMACWDTQNLYIAITCGEPLMDAVNRRKTEGLMEPFHESVEIFIDADHDRFTYVQFRVDLSGNRDTHEGYGLNATMDDRWSGAVAQDKDQWTVEAAIPWNLVTKSRPDEKTVWGLNLNRTRSIGSEGAWTCWSDTKGEFHSPTRFGDLIFFPYPAHLRHCFSAAFDGYWSEINRLSRRYPGIAAICGAQIQSLQTECDQFLKALESSSIAKSDQADSFRRQGAALEGKLENLRDEVYLQVIRAMASGPGGKP